MVCFEINFKILIMNGFTFFVGRKKEALEENTVQIKTIKLISKQSDFIMLNASDDS